MRKALKSVNPFVLRSLSSSSSSSSSKCYFGAVATAGEPESDDAQPSCFTFSSDVGNKNKPDGDSIFLKPIKKNSHSTSSVTMPMSFMTGSIVGKRFYKQVTTREAEDGNGWTVMLDYRTLKTPSKKPLKCPTITLAKAIAAEWDYQESDGIRPFTMPLMKLACTALERVPLTRQKIIEHLLKKFPQDLVFCRAPGDNDLTSGLFESFLNNRVLDIAAANIFDVKLGVSILIGIITGGLDKKAPFIYAEKQVEKMDPLLKWVESEFGTKPAVYSSFFGGKQEDSLLDAVECLLKKTDNCELAAIDAMAAAAHSLIISIAIFRGRLSIEDAIELIRLEEDLQVDRWGLVEGGHDVDVADLRVQMASAAVFLGLSRKL